MFKRTLFTILFALVLIPVSSFSAPKACFREFNPALDSALTSLENRLKMMQNEIGISPLLSFKIGPDPRPKKLDAILLLNDPAYLQYVNIIKAAQKIFEQNPLLEKLAEEGNRILQDPILFAEFAKEFSEQLVVKEKNQTSFSVLVKWAKSWGWLGSIEVYDNHDFLRDSIGKRLLFRDSEMKGTRHGADSHAVQLAYLSWHFTKIFGVEQTMEFMEFLSTREGTVIWKILIDRRGAPNNLRSPDTLHDHKILQAFGMD